MYCVGFTVHMYYIVGLYHLRFVPYRTVRGLPYVLYCIARSSYHTVLYSPRRYSTNPGSYVLCGVCHTCMYCIVGLSLSVRIVSHRILLCKVCLGLFYCIARSSYRTVLYSQRKYSTNRVSYVLVYRSQFVSYCAGFAVCRPIVLDCPLFVSYCASGHTLLTLSSDCVVLSRIISRFHYHVQIVSSFAPDCIMIYLGPYCMKPTV
jgi:hypothetical protein